MAASFEYRSKFARSGEFYDAGLLLFEADHFRQAVVSFWISVRHRIFGWLEKRELTYEDTQSALRSAMANIDVVDMRSAVVFLYTIGLMAEWDETFSITEAHAADYMRVSETALAFFSLEGKDAI